MRLRAKPAASTRVEGAKPPVRAQGVSYMGRELATAIFTTQKYVRPHDSQELYNVKGKDHPDNLPDNDSGV